VEGAANLLGRLPPPFSFFGVSFSAGQSRSFRSASSTARKKTFCKKSAKKIKIVYSSQQFLTKKLRLENGGKGPKRWKGVHCVDLGESFPTSTYLQNLASVQPRTSLCNFFNLVRPWSFNFSRALPPCGSLPENFICCAATVRIKFACFVGFRYFLFRVMIVSNPTARSVSDGESLQGIASYYFLILNIIFCTSDFRTKSQPDD